MDERAGGPQDIALVRTAARAFERDRYLAALLAPSVVRDDLIALAAFAGEIARIPGSVSEPMIGEIRLQWWRDTLCAPDASGNVSSGHPIADAVAAALRRHRLPLALIEQLIDAQVQRLGDGPFADATELDAHLTAWDGGQFELAWRVLGGEGAAPAILPDAGRVYGMARLLTTAPFEFAQGHHVLPFALPDTSEPAGDGPPSAESVSAWGEAFSALASQVESRLDIVAKGFQEAESRVRQAALPVAVVRPYLKASERVKPFPPVVADIGPFARIWRIWRASRTGRV